MDAMKRPPKFRHYVAAVQRLCGCLCFVAGFLHVRYALGLGK